MNGEHEAIWTKFEDQLWKEIPDMDSKICDKLKRSYLQTTISFRKYSDGYLSHIIDLINSRKEKYIVLMELKQMLITNRDKKSASKSTEPSTSSGPTVSGNNTEAPPRASTSTTVKSLVEDVEVPKSSSKDARTAVLVSKLEAQKEAVNKEINKLEERELSLDDLDEEDSAYIRLDYLKKRSVLIHKQLCKLNRTSRHTGRLTEKRFYYEGTSYSTINEAVANLVNTTREMPEYRDILKIVRTENSDHNLEMNRSKVFSTARDIFLSVVKALRKRRQDDYKRDMGCFLTDVCRESFDPALVDSKLRCQLQDSLVKGEKRMEEEINRHVQLQEEFETLKKKSGTTTDTQEDCISSDAEKQAADTTEESDVELEPVKHEEMVGWQNYDEEEEEEEVNLHPDSEEICNDVEKRKIMKYVELDEIIPKEQSVSLSDVKLKEQSVSLSDVKPKEQSVSHSDVKPKEQSVSHSDVKLKQQSVSLSDVKPKEQSVSSNDVNPKEQSVSHSDVKLKQQSVSLSDVKPKEQSVSLYDVNPKELPVSLDENGSNVSKVHFIRNDIEHSIVLDDSLDSPPRRCPTSNNSKRLHFSNQSDPSSPTIIEWLAPSNKKPGRRYNPISKKPKIEVVVISDDED